MKKLILITTFVFSIFFIHAQNSTDKIWQPSPYDAEVVKAFADSLYSQGFLTQAEGEYKRFLFSFGDCQDQEVLLALTNIYKKQKNADGITWLRDNFYDKAQPPVKEKMNFVQAEFIFKQQKAQDFTLFSDSIVPDRKNFSPDFKNLVDISELILKNDIGGLKAFCPAAAKVNPDFENLNLLCQSYKSKSPGLALFLSSLIPGSGKWYTGSFGAFASSFLTISSFAAGTVVTGIQSQWKSWQPYVFGSCGVILYIAELYGSYQSAKRYNASLFRLLCEETEKLYEKEY